MYILLLNDNRMMKGPYKLKKGEAPMKGYIDKTITYRMAYPTPKGRAPAKKAPAPKPQAPAKKKAVPSKKNVTVRKKGRPRKDMSTALVPYNGPIWLD